MCDIGTRAGVDCGGTEANAKNRSSVGGCTDEHGRTRTYTDTDRDASNGLSSALLAANAILSLINIDCYLLDRQIAKLANAFEQEGGFSERLYRVRSSARKRH